jgi:two-component system CheB/CheR fusion protein
MTQPSSQFLVVGVGASAGGVEALQAFFAHVPADSGCAYVAILHLSPDYASQLATILQQVTPLPVLPVSERVRVEPGHVYVVPPNQHLTMADGDLLVSPNTQPEDRRAPIDIFFRTLAESHDGRAVCVVLSGTGADGSMGLKRVKECGGAVFVQTPREAAFGEMPRAAIATELVDDVLPVAEIPARITAYQASLATVAIPVEAEQRPELQQQALREVLMQLRLRTGHDFANYKRPTLLRRIERRISVCRLPDLQAYAAFLIDHPDEVQALLKDLLISVTNFFRDPEAFAAFEQEVLPRLFQNRRSDAQVRIWVVGCATGEEAYSIAMLCAERTFDVLDAPGVQIFATDIDEAAIARAREGLYSASDTADVSPERLRRFFTKEDDRYRVRRELRELVLFATHNVLKDPPFAHLDLATCRNVLIYLNQTAQERVMETLHFAINPNGFLFLGTAETTDGTSDLFTSVNREQRIFQRRYSPGRPLPLPELGSALREIPPRAAPQAARGGESGRERVSPTDLHQRLLEQYAPPSLIVNQDFAIMHLSDRAGRYLQLTGGEPTNNLLALIRPELHDALRTALVQAIQRQANVDVGSLPVRIDERVELVTIQVRPVLRLDDPAQGVLLVLFEADAELTSTVEPILPVDEPAARQLEEEVLRLKRQLRTTSDRYELQTEELKATNEELQALNEELRSSTEELETSKEELQSINEELRTVNQELKVKVEEATLTSTNLQNLVNSTDIGTIFLDRNLRVRLFTPAARALFNLIPTDYGRPLSDITSRLVDGYVLEDAEAVLATLQTVEREVRTTDARVLVLRVLPYRASEDRIGGVVLTFFDLTERKRVEEVLRASEERQAFLLRLGDAMRLLANPLVVQAEACRLVGERLHVNRATYADLDGGAFIFRPGYVHGVAPLVGRRPLETFGAALLEAYRRGETVAVDDVRTDPRFAETERAALLALDIAAFAGVMLGKAGSWVGTFSIHSATPRQWTVVELDLVAEVAERIGDAVERARTEEALRASETRQAAILETMAEGVVTIGLDERFVSANPAAERILGVPSDELIGQSVNDPPFVRLTLDGAPLATQPTLEEVAASDDHIFQNDYVIERRDGTRVTISRNIAALRDSTGACVGFVSTITDITERTRIERALRESEQRFRVLADEVPQVIWANDAKGQATYFNARWFDYSGLSYEQSAGSGWQAIVHPDDAPASVERWQRALAAGIVFDTEYRLRRADGVYRWYLGRNVPLRDEAGRVIGWFGSATDIEEIKQAEAARRESEEALQRAHDELEQRVAERTAALASSNLALEEEIVQRTASEAARQLLQRQLAAAQEEERLRIARDLHDQLGQQITGLQLGLKQLEEPAQDTPVAAMLAPLQALAADLAKEAHRLAVNLRPTALDDIGLVPALEQLAASWSAQTGVAVVFQSYGLEQHRLPRPLEVALYRVVQEALTNVSKHSQATSVGVIIERRADQVVLMVEDNGRGFDADALLAGQERSGLGVLGMRERIAQVGGTLEIESSLQGGTTVLVRIPLDTMKG